jgi:hypothetical protein
MPIRVMLPYEVKRALQPALPCRAMVYVGVVACTLLVLVACQTSAESKTDPASDEVPAGASIDDMPMPEGEFSFAGGDGTALDRAVIVTAPDENVGVAALYGWIGKNYPGSKAAGQTTVIQQGRYFDAIDIVTAGKERRTLYFDITSFFGKF